MQALHTRVGKSNGPYLANRLLDLLGAMYNKARDIGYTGDNPAKGIKKFKEEKRDRFLQGDELPAFFKALASEPNDLLRDFFLVALLTGARRANVQAMRWDDLDLDRGSWRIPGSEAKAGETIVLPLVAPALAILAARYKARKPSPWVFPSWGATGHLVEPKGAWKRICKKAGLVDVRIHDLRRSLEAGRLWAELPCRSSARASVTPRSRRRPSTPGCRWTQFDHRSGRQRLRSLKPGKPRSGPPAW